MAISACPQCGHSLNKKGALLRLQPWWKLQSLDAARHFPLQYRCTHCGVGLQRSRWRWVLPARAAMLLLTFALHLMLALRSPPYSSQLGIGLSPILMCLPEWLEFCFSQRPLYLIVDEKVASVVQ